MHTGTPSEVSSWIKSRTQKKIKYYSKNPSNLSCCAANMQEMSVVSAGKKTYTHYCCKILGN